MGRYNNWSSRPQYVQVMAGVRSLRHCQTQSLLMNPEVRYAIICPLAMMPQLQPTIQIHDESGFVGSGLRCNREPGFVQLEGGSGSAVGRGRRRGRHKCWRYWGRLFLSVCCHFLLLFLSILAAHIAALSFSLSLSLLLLSL